MAELQRTRAAGAGAAGRVVVYALLVAFAVVFAALQLPQHLLDVEDAFERDVDGERRVPEHGRPRQELPERFGDHAVSSFFVSEPTTIASAAPA